MLTTNNEKVNTSGEEKSELERQFDELAAEAAKLYPDIEEAMQAFNTASVPIEEYRNFLNLRDEIPFSTASTHIHIA